MGDYPTSISALNPIDRDSLIASREWTDWKWQLRNRIRTVEELERWVVLTDDERNAIEATKAH